MFESVNNSTPNIKSYNSQSSIGGVNYLKAAQLAPKKEAESPEKSNRSGTGIPPQAAQEQLKDDFAGLHHIDIQFSVHEHTGKTMIKIVDKENNEVIREIPSREDLERSARLQAYVGQLFDETA